MNSERKQHKWTIEEAREAGKKGGAKVALDKEHMRRIARLGGAASAAARLAKKAKHVP